MGQSPPTTRHRVPSRGEPDPQGAAEGAPPPADRRPAPTPRREGPTRRSTALEAGRDPRDSRHDPAMASAADRSEVDVHADAARPVLSKYSAEVSPTPGSPLSGTVESVDDCRSLPLAGAPHD